MESNGVERRNWLPELYKVREVTGREMGESPEALMMPALVHHVQLQPDLCAAPGTLRPSPVALRAR